MLGNISLYLIIGLVASPITVILLCFLAKLIHLKRAYTELIIPIIGALVLIGVFQIGIMSSGIIDILAIIVPTATSQLIYVICRIFGNKSTAPKRHWIFIALSFLLVVVSFAIILSTNLKDSILMLDFFVGCLLNFILMLFNMIFYKITKEISFLIRKKKNQ